MLKLQGIRPENMRKYRGMSPGVLNAAVGNAMSACVLERLLPRIAYAIGCIPERMPDEWCHPGFIAAGGRFGKLGRRQWYPPPASAPVPEGRRLSQLSKAGRFSWLGASAF